MVELQEASAGEPRGVSIELRNLTKRFSTADGERIALDGFNLEARPGEFIAVIGQSGCGKSTAFNIAAGLDEPTSGDVLIDGALAERRLGLSAYMPQRDGLLPWRTVLDNTTIALELAGVSRRNARKHVRPLIDRFGLGAFADAWPWQLSGGMRYRAAFLRTVITRPSLLLLDEPFGSLDGITRADLQEWLESVWLEYGSTVLLVTHDVSEATFLADRVYVMTPRPGRVSAIIEIPLARPRTRAVQETDAFSALEQQLRHALNQNLSGRSEPANTAV